MLLHRKRQDYTVSHPNSKLGAVTSKKTRLSCFPFEQWPCRCYIGKNETEPFPIWTVTLAPLHRKKQDWAVSHRSNKLCIVTLKKPRLNCSAYQQRTQHCYIARDKTGPFPIPTETYIYIYFFIYSYIYVCIYTYATYIYVLHILIRIRLTFVILSNKHRCLYTWIYIYRCIYFRKYNNS